MAEKPFGMSFDPPQTLERSQNSNANSMFKETLAKCRVTPECRVIGHVESLITISPPSLRVPQGALGFTGPLRTRHEAKFATRVPPLHSLLGFSAFWMARRLVHLEGPCYTVEASDVSQSSANSRTARCHGSQWCLASGVTSGRPARLHCLKIMNEEHHGKVRTPTPIDLSRVRRSSPFYLTAKEDLPLLVEGGGPRPIYQVPERLMKVLAPYPGSRFYGIAGDSEGSLCVMSTGEARFMMYNFVMERLGVKPLVTPIEMVVLSCVILYPTQFTSNSWNVLAGFQLHCHSLGIPPTVKLFSFFYQPDRSSTGQPWHFAKNRPLFPLVWSKAARVPGVEEKDLSLIEARIVK
ncbi:putative transmembrane protein [Senna tora]|uniref:Putative transmembrane protein n=1 Tax=Senna tora TaxID=362788 RepID=A0A834XF75_9FABA|nr:putative transmembrane protein [Senna tora]